MCPLVPQQKKSTAGERPRGGPAPRQAHQPNASRTVTRRRGFTLIETIAAVVILAIAVPPILWAVREAHIQRVDPVQTSRARWLAVEKLEDIIADRHAPSRGYDYIVGANYPDEPAVDGFPAFSRSVNIAEAGPNLDPSPPPGEGYKIVTVTVSWTDGRGESRSFDLGTVLAEGGE